MIRSWTLHFFGQKDTYEKYYLSASYFSFSLLHLSFLLDDIINWILIYSRKKDFSLFISLHWGRIINKILFKYRENMRELP